MAFGFFRRRQKMVIIIMVILMVSFLVGFQGFQMLFNPSRDPLMGRMAGMGDEKITHSIFVAADSDVNTMKKLLSKSQDPQAAFSGLRGIQSAFWTLESQGTRGEHDVALAFVLLQVEATKARIRVSDSEVEASIDELVREWGVKNLPDGSADRDSFYMIMRDNQVSKPNVISAMAHWLMIYKYFEANQSRVPPSEPELRRVYRDTHEKIAVRLTTLKAADFLDKVREPGEADLQALFKQFQNNSEGDVAVNDFGLGYKQPDRASVQYLLLRDSVVKRGSQPTDQQIKQYYLDNQAKYERSKKQLSDVKEEIADILRDRVVKTHADNVLSQAEALINPALAKSDSAKVNVYEDVRVAMMLPAEEVLAKPLTNVHLDGTVEQAVNELAVQAELNAIVYPYDVPGEVNIGKGLRVTLDEAQITLGEALQKITDKAMGPQGPTSTASSRTAPAPRIVWKMCKGFEGVLFPVGPDNLDLFPLQAGETGLKSGQEMSENPVVGYASTAAQGAGVKLLQLVFNSPVFKTNNPSTVSVGSVGQQMVSNIHDATGGAGGELQPQGPLLWRLADARGAYVPKVEELQTDPRLHAKVVKDWKDREAYGLALEEARKITKAARERNLEAALKDDETARKLKLKTTETKPFSRKTIRLPQYETARNLSREVEYRLSLEMYMSGKKINPQDIEQAKAQVIRANMPQILSRPPFEMDLGNPGEDLGLGDSFLSVQQFLDAAFTLAPAKVEPPYKDKAPVVLAELKLPREVMVMERSDFVPAVVGEFEGIAPNPAAMPATALAGFMVQQQEWLAQRRWFALGPATDMSGNTYGIVVRTGYKKESGQE